MKNNLFNIAGLSQSGLKPDQVERFFISHLNTVYSIKMHLLHRLPELAEQIEFNDLKHAILETCEDVNKQVSRIAEIFVLLDVRPALDTCEELVGFIDDGLSAIYRQSLNYPLRDLSILSYMSYIESTEMAYFKILVMTAPVFSNKQIKQLLRENFDESKADNELFLSITAKYIK